MKKLLSASLLLFVFLFDSLGQGKAINDLESQYLNWFNKDLQTNNQVGISVEKAYSSLLKNKTTKKTVIVAVIDGGVDINHEELEGKIWVNTNEIPNNQIDDDNNGYIDDIHGWNFIGSSTGENIQYENYEFTRILKDGNANDPLFQKAKTLYDLEFKQKKEEKENLKGFEDMLSSAKNVIKENTGIVVKSSKDLDRVYPTTERAIAAKRFLKQRYDMGFTEEILVDIKKRNSEFFEYYLNKDFSPRNIIGDQPKNLNDRNYGNSDVKGPRADHGTSVAGVIAAIRNNNKGIDGIATDVKIMVLRTTPNGDERDKDVALAIMYAAANGADIINMSFGKKLSPQKSFVDEAVKFAEEKDVLLIHSAGNSGENIDIQESFPNGVYSDGSEIKNWFCIGASGVSLDNKIAAIFSNYGKTQVDIFAPGVNIISLDVENTYSMNDGTSLSGPIVSGVAALVLSYYPDLTSQELIDILMVSSYKITKPKKVLIPSLTAKKRSKSTFRDLSQSGGIVNAYNALLEAENRYK